MPPAQSTEQFNAKVRAFYHEQKTTVNSFSTQTFTRPRPAPDLREGLRQTYELAVLF